MRAAFGAARDAGSLARYGVVEPGAGIEVQERAQAPHADGLLLTQHEALRAAQRVLGLVEDLVVGEARDREACELEVHVLLPIAFEGLSHRVKGVAVDLDHPPLLSP